jgi:hypothetical protein
MMQKFYEAIYDRREVEWLGDAPSCEYARVMLVTGNEDELAEFRKVITALKLPDDVNVFSLLRAMSPEHLITLAKNGGDSVDWQTLQQKDQLSSDDNDNGI